MKKLISLAAALGLAVCLTAAAFADTASAGRLPASQPISISGSYLGAASTQFELVLGDPELDHAELPDGIHIRAASSDTADDGLWIVVIPVTQADEPDAYAWAAKSAEKAGREPVIYYLAIYRGDALVEPEGRVSITMTTPDGYEKGRLHLLDCDGSLSRLLPAHASGSVSFDIGTSGYYVFTKSSGGGSGSGSGSGGSTRPTAPQTGDTFQPLVWCGALALSAAGMAVCRQLRRKDA